MKKLLLVAVAIGFMQFGAKAQTETESYEQIAVLQQEVETLKAQQEQQALAAKQKDIWKRTKFFGINYVWSNLKLENGLSKKSNFGVALNLGNTYFLHGKPILDMIKIGLDAIWMDLNYTNYEKGNFHLPGFDDLLGGGYDDYYDDYYYDYDDDYDYEDELDFGNLGWHKIDLGMGVGPSVHVTPFVSFDNALKDLKAQLYFHFTPSFSALITSDDDETKVHYGFSPVFNFGGVISWRMLGLGVEGRWCTAKFSDIDFEGGSSSSKEKFKTSSCRLFLRLCF